MSLLLKHRYQVLEVLSEAGGFGQTFLAEDTDTPSRRKCVIKKLRPITNEDRKKFKDENALLEHIQFVQERFHREAAILERLGDNCDQIPKLYAYFVENQEFYLVQELIDGLTLRQKLQREGVLDENTVRNLLWSLLNVLEYVHSQNIIHRDIKPDNIILRQRDNKPVLIDFGIVKEVLRVDVDGNPTSSALAGGTPGYTASEQAAGRPAYASDIYSLGATAIYLLTGRNPQQMTDLATGDIAWRQFAPQVTPVFASVLNKATESAARDRYKTVSEMREDLQRVMRGEPTIYAQPLPTTEEETIVRPVTPQPLIQQSQKPNYALYFGGAAVLGLLAIIGAIALLFNLNNPSRETAQVANTQNVNANRNTNLTTTQNTNPSNANSTTANSNAQTNSNVDLTNPNMANANVNANANVAPTPDKAQLQKVMNRYLAGVAKASGDADEPKQFRKIVYGDIDNDGDSDAVVQFTLEGMGGGNNWGLSVAVFRNNDGLFEPVTDDVVGGKLYRSFNLKSIQGNNIIGQYEICGEEDFQRACFTGEKPLKRGQAKITLSGNKLIVPR